MNEIKFNKGVATITSLVDKYKKSGRFTDDMAQGVTNALVDHELKIAVIGKMKAGKSSFVNALIFHDNVLPSGTAPTTVTLTEIAYTDDPQKDSKVEVELLTQSDIEDIRNNANSKVEKISANATDLLSSLNNIKGGYEQYAGKGSVEIDLDELSKFTSADGPYSGLAKKITIYKHLDVLKGLKIIDTPGFNDPVISRGEATKSALKDCQIILFIHDYMDMYDEDEISILQEQVEYTGVSMLVDILNKMDSIEELAPDQWKTYVPKFKENKEKAKKQIGNEGIKQLLSNGKISYVSALMALTGYEVLDDNQKRSAGQASQLSNETKDLFVSFQRDFSGLKDADDFVKCSNIAEIVNIINELSADKSKYLAVYPAQTLEGLLKSLAKGIQEEINNKELDLKSLQQSKEEAQRQLDAINDTFNNLGANIRSLQLATHLNNCINATISNIQNLRKSKCEAEFTKDHYENVNIIGSGPEKRNFARYKVFLFDFDNEIRNQLNHLKDQFATECDAYVNNLVEGLVTNKNISLQDRKLFADVIKVLLHSEMSSGLPIIVNPDEPQHYLYSAQEQHSVYQSDFLNRRSDSVINDSYLKVFSTFVGSTIDSDVLKSAITDQIEALKAKLKKAINYSPADNAKEIGELKGKIEKLTTELNEVRGDIDLLEELKK